MHGATQGWTTMQRTESTRKMTEMVNENINKVPCEIALSDSARSLQVVLEGAILNIHFLKDCTCRTQEYCALQESKWSCWHKPGLTVWQQKSMVAENYNECTYYEQRHTEPSDKHDAKALSTMLAACYCTPHLQRLCTRNKQHKRICRDESKLLGSVTVTSFVVGVVESTTKVYFVSDRTVSKNTERTFFSAPKAVNICYTGTVSGTIQASAIRTEMQQAAKRGPCGSEIHIDTSMGVMQIFGNNGGSRKITCKAFLNMSDAQFIVGRVCAMVIMCSACSWGCMCAHAVSCGRVLSF